MKYKVLAVIALAAVPTVGQAQSGCGWIAEPCGMFPIIGHYNFGPAAGGWQNLHATCMQCLFLGVPVGWSYCHPACPPIDDSEAVAQINDAAARGDVATIIALAPLAPPGLVSINIRRQTVQVMSSCIEGVIIANLPMRAHGFWNAVGSGHAELRTAPPDLAVKYSFNIWSAPLSRPSVPTLPLRT